MLHISKNIVSILILLSLLLFSCSNDDDNETEPQTENQPPSMVGELTTSFLEDSNLQISWSPAIDPENDDITYIIQLSQYIINENSEYFELIHTYETTQTNYLISDIEEANTNYQIYVSAKDALDNESENFLVRIVNYMNSPPDTVTNVELEKSQTTMDISWTHANDPENNSLSYRIDIYQHTNYPLYEPQLIESLTTSNNSITISNLVQLYKYRFQIYTVDAYESESEPFEMYFALLPENTYTGDIVLRSQSDVDVFLNHNIQLINGNLTIAYPFASDEVAFDVIEDLNALVGFESISGNLSIKTHGLHLFDDLSAFSTITNVSGLLTISDYAPEYNSLGNYYFLKDLAQFSSLQSVGSLNLIDNKIGFSGNFNALQNITGNLNIKTNGWSFFNDATFYGGGFPNLQHVGGDLNISSNNKLETITGLNSLASIGGSLVLNSGHHFVNFPDLPNLTEIFENFIIENTGLENIPEMNFLETIGGDFRLSTNSISTISGLNSLSTIGGDFILHNNVSLSSINGLNNLNSINGSFIFSGNHSAFQNQPVLNNLQTIGNGILIEGAIFTNLDFFQNVNSINFIELNNTAIISFTTSNNLTYLESLRISNNDNLTSINLSTISVTPTTIVEVLIKGNNNLVSINGITGFSHFSSLELMNNPLLTDISALNMVNEIDNCLQIHNNDSLTNLDFLSNLTTINCGDLCYEVFDNGATSQTNNLVIKQNFSLGDFCGLTGFFTNNGLCYTEYSILENGFNPTHLEIINDNCTP